MGSPEHASLVVCDPARIAALIKTKRSGDGWIDDLSYNKGVNAALAIVNETSDAVRAADLDASMAAWLAAGCPPSVCGCGHDTADHSLRGHCTIARCQ